MTCACSCDRPRKEEPKEKCVTSLFEVLDELACGVRTRMDEKHGIVNSLTHSALDSLVNLVKCKANDLIDKIGVRDYNIV